MRGWVGKEVSRRRGEEGERKERGRWCRGRKKRRRGVEKVG